MCSSPSGLCLHQGCAFDTSFSPSNRRRQLCLKNVFATINCRANNPCTATSYHCNFVPLIAACTPRPSPGERKGVLSCRPSNKAPCVAVRKKTGKRKSQKPWKRSFVIPGDQHLLGMGEKQEQHHCLCSLRCRLQLHMLHACLHVFASVTTTYTMFILYVQTTRVLRLF